MRTLLAVTYALMAARGQAADDLAPYARERVAVWQTRLGLTAWHVSVGFAAGPEIGGLGDLQYSVSTGRAAIRLVDPAAVSRAADEQAKFVERTVVHELVHLMLVPMKGASGEALKREDERAVKHITEALLAGCKP